MFDKARILQFLDVTHDEKELRQLLCHLLGCGDGSASPTPAPSGSGTTPSGQPATSGGGSSAPAVTVKGSIVNDAFLFHVNLGVPNDQHPAKDVQFQLDTGAFEMLLTKDIADALKLPNQGASQIQGVTGSSSAYKSQVSIAIPGGDPTQGWTTVDCTVDPSFQGTPLFGLRFFIRHKQELTLNPVAQTVTLKTVS